MSDGVFKAPKAKINDPKCEDPQPLSPVPKKRRTAEDFFTFCNFILEYENYEAQKQEELRAKNHSPLGSTGSTAESIKSESTSSSVTSLEDRKPADIESDSWGHIDGWRFSRQDYNSRNYDDDSWDLVTCYCLKPFAGRPMIECSECLTWIHLSCAKIRKSNIPEEFICQRCRDAKLTTRRSQRKNLATICKNKTYSQKVKLDIISQTLPQMCNDS